MGPRAGVICLRRCRWCLRCRVDWLWCLALVSSCWEKYFCQINIPSLLFLCEVHFDQRRAKIRPSVHTLNHRRGQRAGFYCSSLFIRETETDFRGQGETSPWLSSAWEILTTNKDIIKYKLPLMMSQNAEIKQCTRMWLLESMILIQCSCAT